MSISVTIQGGAGISVSVSTKQIVFSTAPSGWDEQIAEYGRGYNYPQPTGQPTVYRTGDDADIESTIFVSVRVANSLKVQNSLTDFLTLGNTNSFNTLDRYTDSVGGQDYDGTDSSLIDYLIDHYTGLGWYIRSFVADNWNNQIDAALASSQNSFSDWFIANTQQINTIRRADNSFGMVYSPFLYSAGDSYTSTTPVTTTVAVFVDNNFNLKSQAKTISDRAIMCRKHF